MIAIWSAICAVAGTMEITVAFICWGMEMPGYAILWALTSVAHFGLYWMLERYL